MPFRSYRSAPVAELGQQTGVINRKRVVLILSAPAVSLLVPGLAVQLANVGGTGELTRIAAAVVKFLLFYSGVFALIGLSAAVAAGLLAADRIVLSPHARILAQTAHRTTSLLGMSALANHIMLEIMANRAGIADSVIPFLAVRSTFFMGLGTIASDVFVLVILTGVLRRRFTTGSRPELWRWLHMTAYAAWLLGILHGLLAGRSAKPYVDWSYGACLAFAGLALAARYVMVHRNRMATAGDRPAPGPGPVSLSSLPSLTPSPAGAVPALPPPQARTAAPPAVTSGQWPTTPAPAPPPAPQRRPLRALPSPGDAWSQTDPRPPGWAGAPWSVAEDRDARADADGYAYADDNGYSDDGYGYGDDGYGDNGYAGEYAYADDNGYAADNGYAGEPSGWTEPPESWTASPDAWRPRSDGWGR